MTREEAIQFISNIIHDDISVYGHKDKPRNIALAMAIEALKEQRPHGAWICKGSVGDGTWCSVCDTNIKLFPNRYSFCPKCGADMRKEGENK